MAADDPPRESGDAAAGRQLDSLLAGTEGRERAMLGAAIHDDPMQLIVASMLQIDYLRMNPTVDDEDSWERVIGMLETSVERLRRLIAAITPADPADGLGETLRDLAVGIFMGTSTTVTVRDDSEAQLPRAQRDLTLRILREALVNARQHACAGTVDLSVECADRFLATIVDDGVGGATDGPGLAGMRVLAEAAGGELRIDSPPGLGTTVTLSLIPE